MKTEVAAQLKAAQTFDCIDKQAERHEQSSERKFPVREQGSARRRKLTMAGLAFEHPPAPIGINGGAAAMGADRVAARIRPSHLAEHLMGCVFGQIAKIGQRQGPRCRGHKKMLRHGSIPGKWPWQFLRYSKVEVYLK